MEQRSHLRFHVRFHSSFSSTGSVGGEGSILDLSIRGCRIESPTNVQPGASLDVRILAAADGAPIRIQQAVVRWSRGRQFGLEFVTMVPEEWARLQRIVKQIEMEPYIRDKQVAEFGKAS